MDLIDTSLSKPGWALVLGGVLRVKRGEWDLTYVLGLGLSSVIKPRMWR